MAEGLFLPALGPVMRKWLDQLPQDKFWETRRKREHADQGQEAQQPLALEDRRSYAREITRDHGMLGALNMAVAVPGEQVVKAAGYRQGRAGFFDPLANIGAGYTGILQGLDDNGMFGRRRD
jgi:hypothetical protein